MTSPFEFVKSFTTTKEDLYTSENIFNREYNSFMVNRILSNSPATALFASAMNMYPYIDKKLQHDFYLYGIPKSKSGYSKYIKKEVVDLPQDEIDFISETLNMSTKRAIELHNTVGSETIKKMIASRGGRK